jgi:hypothetical protein
MMMQLKRILKLDRLRLRGPTGTKIDASPSQSDIAFTYTP